MLVHHTARHITTSFMLILVAYRILVSQSINNALLRHPPRLKPFQMFPLRTVAHHAEGDGAEVPVQSDDCGIEHHVEAPLEILAPVARRPVDTKAGRDDGEPQRRVVVMNVRHSCHDQERHVVQKPADDRVNARIVNVVNVVHSEIRISALPADEVEDNH